MLIVTGATGQLGSRIVRRLLDQAPADTVGVSVRDPDRAGDLAARGVRVRRGDFTDPASLRDSFEGADRVLVVSAAIRGPGALAANTAALDAASAAGAARVLYTSHQAAHPDSLFGPQPIHAATEDHLARLGVPYVALRHGFYTSTLAMLLAGAAETGRVVAPEDGPVSWTTHDDLAAVDALCLLDGGLLDGALPDGISPPLTAPEALDLAEVARLASSALGREVVRVTVSDDEWLETSIARGMPGPAAEFTLGIFRAARRGEFDVVDPTLETLLGRPAVRVGDVIAGLLG